MSTHSNHQELIDTLDGWFKEEVQMGEVAALTQGQVKRIESALKYFDSMLVPEAHQPIRLERRAREARDTMTAYLHPLKRTLGHVLSFEPDAARAILPLLISTHRDMKAAYDDRHAVEREMVEATRQGDEPSVGLIELGNMLWDFLRGVLKASELLAAIQILRDYLADCHHTLMERLADLETQEGVDLLIRAANDARRGYECGYNTLTTMEQCLEHDNLELLRSCQQDLVETAELLKRARAWADDATEEGWLNWQESYNLEWDVLNQPEAGDAEPASSMAA